MRKHSSRLFRGNPGSSSQHVACTGAQIIAFVRVASTPEVALHHQRVCGRQGQQVGYSSASYSDEHLASRQLLQRSLLHGVFPAKQGAHNCVEASLACLWEGEQAIVYCLLCQCAHGLHGYLSGWRVLFALPPLPSSIVPFRPAGRTLKSRSMSSNFSAATPCDCS